MADSPCSAREGLVIGVTGHRIRTDLPRIESGIVEALERLRQAYPARSWTVLSSLAEGADRTVARQALEMEDARLVVPLPLQAEEYRRDFRTAESRADFDALLARAAEVVPLASAPRPEAYAAAGRYVAEHCDVLVAVWDGEAAQGPSGTGEVMESVRALGKPVLIVHSGKRRPGTEEPTTLGDEQGTVVIPRAADG